MKYVKLLLLALCIPFALGQNINQKGTKEQDTFVATQSGVTVIMQDGLGTQTNQFEIIPTGAPASVSITIVGCMRSNTCTGTLASTTNTTPTLLSINGGPYDYYQITPSWTGGSSPTIKINRTGTAAKSNNGGAAASVPFSGITSGNNTQAIMGVGNGASLAPVGSSLGQVASTLVIMQSGIIAPTISTGAGGSIVNAHGIHVVVTYNTVLGETLPSIESTVTTLANNSAITVTAPTLSSGYTGYTVYDYDANAGGPTTWQKQTSTPNCVNIVTNCVITNSNVATSGAPTISTAIIQPPNVQATNGPLGWIPTLYFPKTDGNYYPWAGVEVNSCDAVTGPPLPCGTPMFTHRTWFADDPTNTPVGGRNAFVVIDHTAGIGTALANQDRTLWIDNRTPANDAAARYAIEGIQDELDFNCNGCTINGSPDAEVTAGSFQLATAGASTNWSPAGYSTNAVQGRVFRNGAGFDNTGISAIYGNAANNNSTAAAGSTLIGLRSNISSNVSAPNMTGHLIDLGAPSNTNFGIIRGIFANGGFTPRATDHFIDQRVHNWNSYLNGTVNLTGVSNSDEQSLPVSASLNDSGSVTVSQVPSSFLPGQVSVSTTIGCSGGASGYNYQMVCVDGNGGQAPGSVINTASTCTNPLTSGNPATITTGATSGTDIRGMCTRLDVYRVGGPMATGKIGSLSLNSNFPINGMNSFVDTGLAPTTAVPTINTTGSTNSYLFGTLTNCAAIGSSANPSVAACAAASAGSFSCATAASTGTCTINTTAVTANSQIFLQQRSDTTTGTRLGVTCNTGVTTVIPDITAVVAATSFTINLGTVAVNPECFSYFIVNQ